MTMKVLEKTPEQINYISHPVVLEHKHNKNKVIIQVYHRRLLAEARAQENQRIEAT
jgi:hypothetical protein